jgi:hypothetical protein
MDCELDEKKRKHFFLLTTKVAQPSQEADLKYNSCKSLNQHHDFIGSLFITKAIHNSSESMKKQQKPLAQVNQQQQCMKSHRIRRFNSSVLEKCILNKLNYESLNLKIVKNLKKKNHSISLLNSNAANNFNSSFENSKFSFNHSPLAKSSHQETSKSHLKVIKSIQFYSSFK